MDFGFVYIGLLLLTLGIAFGGYYFLKKSIIKALRKKAEEKYK